MECFRRECLQGADVPVLLDPQREQSVGTLPGGSRHAPDEFFLQHENGAGDGRGQGKEILQNRAARRIGQVAEQFHGAFGKERAGIPRGAVGLVHFYMRCVRPAFFLISGEARVKFHKDKFAAERRGIFSEGARAGAYFDDAVAGGDCEVRDYPPGGFFVGQKVLPKCAAGCHPAFIEHAPYVVPVHFTDVLFFVFMSVFLPHSIADFPCTARRLLKIF